jgi:type IV pilus assembly protein PilN
VIRINLIPPEYEEAQSKKELRIMLGVGGGIIITAMVLFLVMKKSQSRKLNKDIQEAQIELDRYQTIVAQINQINTDKQRLTERRDVIKNLNRSRLIYPVLFDDLLPIVPSDIWVTSMLFDDQGGGRIKVSMDTRATTNFALATWLTNLQQSVHFSSVDLGPISYTKSEQGSTLNFKITCVYQHSGPFPLVDTN